MTNHETPGSAQALIAVDLGAESCRVSLLRWVEGKPQMQVVHRFGNGPVTAEDGSLRWPLETIVSGVEDGLRMCAEFAPEGIASIGVDGWAVDYVRVDGNNEPLEHPYCYRDERNVAAQTKLHEVISSERLREITGLQIQPLNTLYQLYADRLAGRPSGECWLNLPEYLLARWSGERVAEFSTATHTEMVALETRDWSTEILNAAGIDSSTMARIVPAGTVLGPMGGELARLDAFKNTVLIAPACHDTASAIHGIPARGADWGYVSSGTWSLVGMPSDDPANDGAAQAEQITNMGLDGERLMLQKNVNGMWMLKQCMNAWAAEGKPWEIVPLVAAAAATAEPEMLLDVDDPELLKMGDMPGRVNAQLIRSGAAPLDASSAGAPVMAGLIFRSLAAKFAAVFVKLESLTGRKLDRIFFVGGGSRNKFLLELTAKATGKQVFAGSAESSTVGNFALQLAARDARGEQVRHAAVAEYAKLLCESE